MNATQSIRAVILVATVLNFGPIASAASISLVLATPSQYVDTGDTVMVDVVIDFSDQPVLGGGLSIGWDPDALRLESLTVNEIGDPAFYRPPDVYVDALDGWNFADLNGVAGPHVVGQVGFSVLPTMGRSTELIVVDCFGYCHPFVSVDDFVTIVLPEFNGLELRRVPVPAAMWLLASAMTMLAFVRPGGRRVT